MITIFLADDHPLMRDGIAALIEEEDDLELIGEAENGDQAMEMLPKLKPDVALLDIRMPGLDGISVARRMKEEGMTTKVIMITASEERPYILASLSAGASGFVVKTSAGEVLPEAIRAVMNGEVYLDPAIADNADADTSLLEPLSAREREVLLLSSRGLPVKEVSSLLHITERTVQAHLSSVYSKFGGAKNKTEALIIALKNGIFTVDELLNDGEGK